MSRLRAIRLVAMREILERGRSRGYVISLLFTLFLLMAGFILPGLLLGNEVTKIGVIAPEPAGLRPAIEAVAAEYGTTIELASYASPTLADTALRDKAVDAVLSVPADLSTPGEIIVLERASDQVRSLLSQAVVAIRAKDVTPLLASPSVTALEPPAESDVTAIIFANAGIILMFIGIFSYGSWVLMGVVEEKQSRVVEVVLSTVRARDLLIGKVIGIGILALGQLLVIVGAGIAAAQLSGQLTLPPTTVFAVAQLLLWFLLGFAFYSTAMGFLGSLASRQEEAQNASMPVTTTAMVFYFASIFVVTQDPGGVVARVLTFIPPAAPMVVPIRAALGTIDAWEVVASIVVMLAAIWVLFVVGARVYAGAVLQIGSRVRIRDAWRARS